MDINDFPMTLPRKDGEVLHKLRRRGAGNQMRAGAYYIVAEIINKIEDRALRQVVANHFATEFNKRSYSFDPYEWGRKTGGKCAPGSARS